MGGLVFEDWVVPPSLDLRAGRQWVARGRLPVHSLKRATGATCMAPVVDLTRTQPPCPPQQAGRSIGRATPLIAVHHAYPWGGLVADIAGNTDLKDVSLIAQRIDGSRSNFGNAGRLQIGDQRVSHFARDVDATGASARRARQGLAQRWMLIELVIGYVRSGFAVEGTLRENATRAFSAIAEGGDVTADHDEADHYSQGEPKQRLFRPVHRATRHSRSVRFCRLATRRAHERVS